MNLNVPPCFGSSVVGGGAVEVVVIVEVEVVGGGVVEVDVIVVVVEVVWVGVEVDVGVVVVEQPINKAKSNKIATGMSSLRMDWSPS
jgi:hypothetical protein